MSYKKLCLLAVCTVLWAMALAEPTAVGQLQLYEGESQSFGSYANVVGDSGALPVSDPKALRHTAAGTTTRSVALDAGEDLEEIAVRARNRTSAPSQVCLIVRANGVKQGGVKCLSTSQNTYQWVDFARDAAYEGDLRTIAVQSTNMHTDDQVFVDRVTLNGTEASADTDPPETTTDSGPSGTTYDNDLSYAFSSDEAGVAFECSLDTGAPSWSTCASPKAYADVADGSYTFRVRATDAAQNVDPTPASHSFTVDQPSGPCNFQNAVDAAPNPGTITLPAGCVARESVNVNKTLDIDMNGAVVMGTDNWPVSNFSSVGNGNYRSTNTVPNMIEPNYTNDPNNPDLCNNSEDPNNTCREVEQIFVDGNYIPQLPDNSDPDGMEFSMDGSRRVILGFDPTGYDIEVSMRQNGIEFTESSEGSEIRNGRIFGVATSVRGDENLNDPGFIETGSALANNGNDLIIENIEVSYSHASGVGCGGASCTVDGLYSHHNGVVGFSSDDGDPLVLTNSRVSYNGAAVEGGQPDLGYNDSFNTAGAKITGASATTKQITNNTFDHNDNAGLWLDVSADNANIEGNTIHHSEEKGIFVEITNEVNITDNVIYECGWLETANSFTSAGIYNSDSGNVDASGNVIAWCDNGFTYQGGSRNSDNAGNSFSGNTVIMGGDNDGGAYADSSKHNLITWKRDGDSMGSGDLSNNNNHYYGGVQNSGGKKLQLDTTSYNSLSAFSGTVGEGSGSSWLTWTQADAVLDANGIPDTTDH